MHARTIAKLALIGAGYLVYRNLVAAKRTGVVGRDLRKFPTRLAPMATPEVEMELESRDAFAGLDEAGGFLIDSGDGRSAAVDDDALETVFDSAYDLDSVARRDEGDLYGIITQAAVDTDLSADEDEDGFAHSGDGETWLEALSASATEFGALPERSLDIIDERADGAALRVNRDVPVADYGSGGRGGV